jgi:hypothetical protein
MPIFIKDFMHIMEKCFVTKCVRMGTEVQRRSHKCHEKTAGRPSTSTMTTLNVLMNLFYGIDE